MVSFAASLALWAAAGAIVLSSERGPSTANVVGGMLLVLSLLVTGASVVRAVVWLPRGTWITRVWWLLSAGLFIDVVAGCVVTASDLLWAGHLGPLTQPWLLLIAGQMLVGVAMLYSARQLRGTAVRGRPFLAACVLAAVIEVWYVGALIAPGPSMPFAIGALDQLGLVRITLITVFVLLPASYSTFVVLQWPGGQRARSWMWVSIAALVWGMAAVALPLVDEHTGTVYPLLLWVFAVQAASMGLSVAVDLEQPAAAAGAVPYGVASE